MNKVVVRNILASAGLITTAALWGGNHVVIRSIADQTSPFDLVFWRWTLSAVALVLFTLVPLWRVRVELRKQAGPIFLLGFINCVVFSLAIIAAPFGTAAANVGLIQATAPLWVVLAGALLSSDGPDMRSRTGLLLGFGGTCALVLSGQCEGGNFADVRWGDAAALIATLVWAAYSLLLRWTPLNVNPVLQFSAIILAGYALLLPLTIFSVQLGIVQNPLAQIPTQIWLPILYVGLGATLLGNLFWNCGVHALGPGPASQFLFLAPLCSILFGAIWLGEIPSILGWIGTVAVLTGLICSTLRK
ncbi:MAG: DMT family transporter [Sulfitobacter sp.]